ncbi:MAG: FAD-dependent oxidoreductase [Acidimicrobiaceae bacterium]|nr:FAD-dependent oxidoreductase [Acidimicrobiaceae bacterium]
MDKEDRLRQAWELPSFWLSEIAPIVQRQPLEDDIALDVAIVGGGYSGLWTALYLSELAPELKVAVFEKEIVGYGASGRNGGWVSALFPVSWEKVASEFGASLTSQLASELAETVDEVERKVRSHGIECDFARVGKVSLIRSPAQAKRAKTELSEHQRFGNADGLQFLDLEAEKVRLRANYAFGALYSPVCASVQPAKLARGLGDVVENSGVRIYEGSKVSQVTGKSVKVGRHLARANKVVIATEGYTHTFPGRERQLLPLYSMMIATEILDDKQFDSIGSPAIGLCFADLRNLRIYGQVTKDRRIAFGGRGAPYHLGSRTGSSHDVHGPTRALLEKELIELFPQLAGIGFDRHWGGPLGVSRDWFPRIYSEESGGIWRIGGYAGDGVAMSNLAARVLSKKLLGITDKSAASTVFAKAPKTWEPEPFRWIGTNAGLWLTRVVDQLEDRGYDPGCIDDLRLRLIGQR